MTTWWRRAFVRRTWQRLGRGQGCPRAVEMEAGFSHPQEAPWLPLTVTSLQLEMDNFVVQGTESRQPLDPATWPRLQEVSATLCLRWWLSQQTHVLLHCGGQEPGHKGPAGFVPAKAGRRACSRLLPSSPGGWQSLEYFSCRNGTLISTLSSRGVPA